MHFCLSWVSVTACSLPFCVCCMFGNIVNLFDIYCFSEVPFHFSLGWFWNLVHSSSLETGPVLVSLWTLRAPETPFQPLGQHVYAHTPPCSGENPKRSAGFLQTSPHRPRPLGHIWVWGLLPATRHVVRCGRAAPALAEGLHCKEAGPAELLSSTGPGHLICWTS